MHLNCFSILYLGSKTKTVCFIVYILLLCLRYAVLYTSKVFSSHRCDEGFHGQKCVPVHKLHRMIKADFDVTANEMRLNGQDLSGHTDGDGSRTALYAPLDDFTRYDISLVGGQLAEHSEGCDTVLSGKNVFFGAVSQVEIKIGVI